MPIFSEDEEDFESDLVVFASESPPHAETPRHKAIEQAAVTALERSDLRIGSTIAANLDFQQFSGFCRWTL
ncbi:MAG TPA: hypothetical protein DEW10_02255 [Bifidobacterium sp.]|nr:hypothetical protein [Bifidobacterium sp.]